MPVSGCTGVLKPPGAAFHAFHALAPGEGAEGARGAELGGVWGSGSVEKKLKKMDWQFPPKTEKWPVSTLSPNLTPHPIHRLAGAGARALRGTGRNGRCPSPHLSTRNRRPRRHIAWNIGPEGPSGRRGEVRRGRCSPLVPGKGGAAKGVWGFSQGR